MDIPYLRSEFLSEREFLHFLYSSKARKIPLKLSKATEKQLNILIKILTCFSFMLICWSLRIGLRSNNNFWLTMLFLKYLFLNKKLIND